MLEQLKEQVCAANKMLPQYGLVSFTWGNVSGIDRDSGLAGHGPFVWGASPLQAVHNAAILEEIAFMNYHTLEINPEVGGIGSVLLTKHYSRQHGSKAYYGQP